MDYLVTVNGDSAYSFKARPFDKVVKLVSFFAGPLDWIRIEGRSDSFDKVWREVFVGDFGEFEYLYKKPNSKKGRK